jgi:LmbE family N-acetylglucosaminyl deacetylase
MKPTPTPPPDGLDLLAFGAHPDDLEFGCGGVIALETQAGRTAHFIVCSRGEAASHGTPEVRAAEAAQGAALLGAALEFIELDGDGRLEARPAHALRLAAEIRRHRPRILLAPTPVEDQHPDHAALGKLVRDAARLARYGGVAALADQPAHAVAHVLFYAVTPSAEPPGISPLLIDVSAPRVLESWLAAMKAHASQLQTRNYPALQLARANVFGARCGVAAAQALFPNDPLVFGSLAGLDRAARHF